MSEASDERFEIEIEIRPEDIDALGHVNNVVFLRWVQEAAVAHWSALTNEIQKAEVVWVVARHEIDYKKPALPSDRVVARTWVGGGSRYVFERHTEILRVADEIVLARARTLWVPVDPASGRPRVVSREVRTLFSVPEDESSPKPRTEPLR
jgi:acyl-CoA thioester hydrolase